MKGLKSSSCLRHRRVMAHPWRCSRKLSQLPAATEGGGDSQGRPHTKRVACLEGPSLRRLFGSLWRYPDTVVADRPMLNLAWTVGRSYGELSLFKQPCRSLSVMPWEDRLHWGREICSVWAWSLSLSLTSNSHSQGSSEPWHLKR